MLRSLSAALVCCAFAALAGCGESISPFTPVPGTESSLLLGEDALNDLSPPVTGTEDSTTVFSFDLSSDPMVLAGTFTDVEVRYHTPSSCDEDVEVFDRAVGVWRRIGFGPTTGFGCFAEVSLRAHLLSHRGLRAQDCLGDSRTLLVRGVSAIEPAPTARAVRLVPGYRAIPIVDQEALAVSGLGYDGRSFWVTAAYRTLLRVSPSGAILGRRATLSEGGCRAVATDRLSVWVVDRTGHNLLEFSPRMQLRAVMPVNEPGVSDLSWAGEDLFYSFPPDWQSRTLIRLHPAPRSADPVLRPIDSLTVTLGATGAFAWLGSETLAVATDDAIQIITTHGDVLHSYPLHFAGVQGMVWDGAVLWILHTDIVSDAVILGGDDPVLTPLRLPDEVALN